MKKRTIFIIAGIIILCLLAVVATHSKGTRRQSLKKNEETDNILSNVDVTNLSGNGVVKMDSYDEDTVYQDSGKNNIESLELSDLKTDPAAAVVVKLGRLYEAGDFAELYKHINIGQIKKDGISQFSKEDLQKIFTIYSGGKKSKIFYLKTYDSKDGYLIASVRMAPVKDGCCGNIIYNYKKATDIRFTVWPGDENGYTFVPYSIIEGMPAFLSVQRITP